MTREPVYVIALGASTPVGRDAWSSAAAVRGGMSGFTRHPFMFDTAGAPMCVAMAPWLDIGCEGSDRFEALLLPAIEQSLVPLAAAGREKLKVALVLGVPPARPGLPLDLDARLRAAIEQAFRRRFAAFATFPAGHAAALVGLHAAAGKLGERSFDACVIAGVESYLEPETLEWVERNDQFHGAGKLNNAWGFIPGEGAGAVLVAGGAALARSGVEPLARILSVGKALEENRIKTRTVCTGEGLTAAFKDGLAGLPSGTKVTDVFCDMNGEPYRADEFGFAALRTKGAFVSASDFVAPADCWGDVSAASGPLAIALSVIAARKGYAKGDHAFVWASSETGERAAVLLHAPVGVGR